MARRSAGVASAWSLRGAFLAVALVVAVPLVVLIGYLAYVQTGRERARVEELAMARAERLGADLDRHLGTRLEALAGAASAVAGGGSAVVESQARRLHDGFKDIDRVLVVDELGAALFTAPAPREGRREGVGDQDWFKRAATASDPFVGTPAQRGPEVVVGLYAPVRTPEGAFRGVVAADLSLRRVQEELGRAGLGPGWVVEVLTDEAVVAARVPALFLMRDVRSLPGYAELLRRTPASGELVFEDGERRLRGTVGIRAAGWTLSVGVPTAAALGQAWRRALGACAAGLVVAAGGVGLAYVIGSRQVGGMERLGAAMSRLATGDVPSAVPVMVSGEVGTLTEGFNRMLSWVRGRLREYEAMSQVEEAAGAPQIGDRPADDVLSGLLRKVVGAMGADAGVLVIQEDGQLVARSAVGLPGITAEGVALRRGQGLAGAVAAGREPVVVPDVEGDYRIDEPYLRDARLRSVVGVPMVAGDQLVGVLEVGYRQSRVTGDDEVHRLSAMARRAAQAIERARAVDAVQRNTQGLEARLAELLAALEQAATGEAEARRQADEARRRAQDLERAMRQQAAQPLPPPQIKEVIVEREVVRADPSGAEGARLRAAVQKTVSAELRAPLSALLDLPRFLVEGLQKPLGEEERQQLEILQERGQEILDLIEGLAVLTGLEAGQVKVARAPFDLPASIQRVARALQPRAAAKGNRIEMENKLAAARVVSDARRVEQVLTNLVLTAIKYTEVGEIRITCYARGADTVITVADDGAGFTPEEQARIFEPFLPVGPRGGRTLPGTGLLLVVCQRLVDALGGRIRVESEVDRGTWFTVTLPGEA